MKESLLFLLSFLALSLSNPLTWRLLSDSGPKGFGSALVYDNSSHSLLLFGSLTTNNTSSSAGQETWRYDLSSGTWSMLHNGTGARPGNRRYAYFGLVRVNGLSLFVVSHGHLGSVEYEDTWVFSLDTGTWARLDASGSGPGARYGGHFGAWENILWMGSGFTKTTSIPSRYIDTYRLIFTDRETARWEVVHGQPTSGNQFNPLVPHGRCLQGSSVVDKDTLVMWGGCMRGGNGGGPCPAEDGWVFDNNEGKWTELPRCATPRVWSAMAPLSNETGKAVLYGGSDNFTKQVISDTDWPEDEVLVVDTDSKEWTRHLVMAGSNGYPSRRYTHAMAAGDNGQVYMFGGRLLSNDSQLNDLWLLEGDVSATRTTGCDRVWFSYAHLHGLFMIIAFGILFPTGALIARYYRCKGRKIWFIAHVTVQITAVVFTIPAFVMIFPTGASLQPTHPHAIIGIILMTIMIVQPINGILRPHIKKGEEKSRYRICWEWFHRIWGASTIVLGLVQVTLGVFLIVPPMGVWIVWILMLFGWVVAFIVHETIKWVCLCKDRDDADEDFEMKAKHP